MWEFLDKPGVLIVLLLALLVFGATRLPDSARPPGRPMRLLKAESQGVPAAHAAVVVEAVRRPPDHRDRKTADARRDLEHLDGVAASTFGLCPEPPMGGLAA